MLVAPIDVASDKRNRLKVKMSDKQSIVPPHVVAILCMVRRNQISLCSQQAPAERHENIQAESYKCILAISDPFLLTTPQLNDKFTEKTFVQSTKN